MWVIVEVSLIFRHVSRIRKSRQEVKVDSIPSAPWLRCLRSNDVILFLWKRLEITIDAFLNPTSDQIGFGKCLFTLVKVIAIPSIFQCFWSPMLFLLYKDMSILYKMHNINLWDLKISKFIKKLTWLNYCKYYFTSYQFIPLCKNVSFFIFLVKRIPVLKSILFKSNMENSSNFKIFPNGPHICMPLALARKCAAHLGKFCSYMNFLSYS